jgi:hypothetical protein
VDGVPLFLEYLADSKRGSSRSPVRLDLLEEGLFTLTGTGCIGHFR